MGFDNVMSALWQSPDRLLCFGLQSEVTKRESWSMTVVCQRSVWMAKRSCSVGFLQTEPVAVFLSALAVHADRHLQSPMSAFTAHIPTFSAAFWWVFPLVFSCTDFFLLLFWWEFYTARNEAGSQTAVSVLIETAWKWLMWLKGRKTSTSQNTLYFQTGTKGKSHMYRGWFVYMK